MTRRNKKNDFPLTRCKYGKSGVRYRKIIRGQHFYFGNGGDADDALADYLATRHHLELGKTLAEARELAARAEGKPGSRVTVDELANRYLADRIAAQTAGRLQEQTLRDYKHAARLLIGCVGRSTVVDELTPNDFARMQRELHKGRQLQTVKNLIVNIKIIFNFAYDRDLIDRPVKYGRSFHVSSREIKRSKVDTPTFYFSAPELRELIDEADDRTRAMILLGINGGLGNRDVAMLRERHIDFDSGWINYPRRKTGQARSFPMWPETAEALKLVIKNRPLAKSSDEFDCVFIGRNGRVLYREHGHNQVRRTFRALLDRVGVFPTGSGFYTLRRTFITIGRKTGRALCVKYIAGHVMSDITDRYDATADNAAEVFDPNGLVEVVKYVRTWLLEHDGVENDELPTLLGLANTI